MTDPVFCKIVQVYCADLAFFRNIWRYDRYLAVRLVQLMIAFWQCQRELTSFLAKWLGNRLIWQRKKPWPILKTHYFLQALKCLKGWPLIIWGAWCELKKNSFGWICRKKCSEGCRKKFVRGNPHHALPRWLMVRECGKPRQWLSWSMFCQNTHFNLLPSTETFFRKVRSTPKSFMILNIYQNKCNYYAECKCLWNLFFLIPKMYSEEGLWN